MTEDTKKQGSMELIAGLAQADGRWSQAAGVHGLGALCCFLSSFISFSVYKLGSDVIVMKSLFFLHNQSINSFYIINQSN